MKLNYSQEYNSKKRKFLRTLLWILVLMNFFLFEFLEHTPIILVFLFFSQFALMIFVVCLAFSNNCPACKKMLYRRLLFTYIPGALSQDLKCPNCGVILQEQNSNNLQVEQILPQTNKNQLDPNRDVQTQIFEKMLFQSPKQFYLLAIFGFLVLIISFLKACIF